MADVALRLPWLWNSLDLSAGLVSHPLSPDHRTVARRILNLAGMWLFGSRNLPISLAFDISQMSQPSRLGRRLKEAIIPHFIRIRELSLHSASMHDLVSFCDHPGSHFPILERISLRIDDELAHTDTLAKIFDLAPLLRKAEIDINSSFLGPDRILFQLPWSQLTHISTYSMSLNAISWRRMLEQCSVLQHGVFSIDEFDDGDEDSFLQFNAPITFSSLLSLRIQFVGEGDVTCLHGYIFPSLICLRIGGDDRDFIWVPPIHSFQFLSLSTLALTRGALPSHELIELLSTMPILTSLTIDIDLNYDLILDYLTYMGKAEPLVPRLEIFNMNILLGTSESYDINPEFSPAKLEKMMHSRWRLNFGGQNPKVASIKKISLTFNESGEVEELGDWHGVKSLLNGYISQGLQLDMEVRRSRFNVSSTLSW